MNYLIIGADGSMGKRYQAIFKHLGHQYSCADINDNMDAILNAADYSDGVVIATPTETHAAYIHQLATQTDAPILCEKPICKDIHDIECLFDVMRDNQTNFTMMMQYSFLDGLDGPSYYNYFRTGNDGLIWDCFQVIALARGSVEIQNDSPIWTCLLNGRQLSLSEMDKAYVEFVTNWVEKPGEDLDYLLNLHKKVKTYELSHGQRR